MGSIPVRVIKIPRAFARGIFNLTRTGIEQGGGAQHRNQSPSGALVSPRVPTARNVYCGCCFMQPVRGIEGTRPPAGGKKEPSGLFFSASGCGSQHPRVPWAARASCWPLPQQLLPASATGRGRRCCRFQRLGMSIVVAAFVLSHKGVFYLTRTGKSRNSL